MTSKLTETYRARLADGDLHPDPAQEMALVHLSRLATALEEQNSSKSLLARIGRKKQTPIKGLYLWGGVGRGKSMLMDLFADKLDVPARRVHFHAFMQEVHAAMGEARKTGVDDAIRPVADGIAETVRVLAFDEVQITDIADAMIVGRLFQRLIDKGVVVVATSNRHPDDLYKDGLNRQLFLPFIDLLKEKMDVVELVSNKDYRQDRLAGAKVYFTPTGPEARKAIDAIWADLATGSGEKLVLNVQKREVEVAEFRNGVARTSFFELCAKPLGAADYLALAEAAKVVIIEEIPLLGRRNFNEARRFVTLIDTLYEAGALLICSASAKPEMLYVEGEGTFEFERTASRLREMQSDDWVRRDR